MNEEAMQKLTDGPKLLSYVESRLQYLADAFADTGNEKMADKLLKLSQDVRGARKMIEEGRGEALQSSLRASEEATGNLLAATLAGVLRPL